MFDQHVPYPRMPQQGSANLYNHKENKQCLRNVWITPELVKRRIGGLFKWDLGESWNVVMAEKNQDIDDRNQRIQGLVAEKYWLFLLLTLMALCSLLFEGPTTHFPNNHTWRLLLAYECLVLGWPFPREFFLNFPTYLLFWAFSFFLLL